MIYNEADDRTTLGVVEGETRTYHGVTGDLLTPEALKGTDAITRITTMVGRALNHKIVIVPLIEIKTSVKQHLKIGSNIERFMTASVVVK